MPFVRNFYLLAPGASASMIKTTPGNIIKRLSVIIKSSAAGLSFLEFEYSSKRGSVIIPNNNAKTIPSIS